MADHKKKSALGNQNKCKTAGAVLPKQARVGSIRNVLGFFYKLGLSFVKQYFSQLLLNHGFIRSQSRWIQRMYNYQMFEKRPLDISLSTSHRGIKMNALERARLKISRIQEEALKWSSSAKPIIPKASSKKPQMQIVYMDPKKMHSRLKKFSNRIDVGKYRMLISVRKNPQASLMMKKKTPVDEFQSKSYKQIFNLFQQDKNTGQVLNLSTKITNMYEIFDDDNFQVSKKKDTLMRSVSQFTQRAKANTSDDHGLDAGSYVIQEVETEDWDGSATSKSFYSLMFKDEGLRFERSMPIPAEQVTQEIIDKRFYDKFFRTSTRKRKTRPNETERIRSKSTLQSSPQSSFLPQSSKIQSVQRQLLCSSSKAGTSQENQEKLVNKFNEILCDIKKREWRTRRRRNSQYFTVQPHELSLSSIKFD